eukprot:10426515-Ditylum_brightwellii.AAC.1
MEEIVEYLKGVECSENKNPPKRNNWNNNSSGPKKTKKQKQKHDKDEESQEVTAKNTSNKKSCKLCKLCKIFCGNADLHTTDHCNKKNLISSLLDGHKKKRMDKAKKEEFCAMAKVFRRPPLRAKNHKRVIHNLLEFESYSDKE